MSWRPSPRTPLGELHLPLEDEEEELEGAEEQNGAVVAGVLDEAGGDKEVIVEEPKAAANTSPDVEDKPCACDQCKAITLGIVSGAAFRHPIFSQSIVMASATTFRRAATAHANRLEAEWQQQAETITSLGRVVHDYNKRTTEECKVFPDEARQLIGRHIIFHRAVRAAMDVSAPLIQQLGQMKENLGLRRSSKIPRDLRMKIKEILEEAEAKVFEVRLIMAAAPPLPYLPAAKEPVMYGSCPSCYATHPLKPQHAKINAAWEAMEEAAKTLGIQATFPEGIVSGFMQWECLREELEKIASVAGVPPAAASTSSSLPSSSSAFRPDNNSKTEWREAFAAYMAEDPEDDEEEDEEGVDVEMEDFGILSDEDVEAIEAMLG